ncbi:MULTISPECIES: alpha/beta-type small acid-soluble spore protein [unclassified Sedimentibacter]|uniref:alpha/beta-type small acid-soluble spore protein n=1 Tax=unclassified Sedimentibacter TaxID=2649220 RepID=UPI0027DF319B|nr:alpha/beta-type small acid-soluble spore protein [Sedimentibacter sp. MB35-C1]WMJ77461.1 alpha/beta-type small acid-soluble spore protein [Sedimentibacter sp. MB35-C1]
MNNPKNSISAEAKQALQQFKMEVSRELSIANPQEKNRANMTSRQNGYVGGYAEKGQSIK